MSEPEGRDPKSVEAMPVILRSVTADIEHELHDEIPLLPEHITAVNRRRFVLFPIRYLAIWRAYKYAMTTLWIADNINASKDTAELNNALTPIQKNAVEVSMTLLGATQKIHERLINSICTRVTAPEARSFFGYQLMSENIHREALSRILSSFVTKAEAKAALIHQITQFKSIRRKSDFVDNWIGDGIPIGEAIFAAVVVQGVFSSTLFRAFQWIPEKDVLSCLSYTHDRISTDREAHNDFMCLLFYHVRNKPKLDKIKDTIAEAIVIEKAFAIELLRIVEVNVTIEAMYQHIEFTADTILHTLDYIASDNADESTRRDKDSHDKCLSGKMKAGYLKQEMLTAYSTRTPEGALQEEDTGLYSTNF